MSWIAENWQAIVAVIGTGGMGAWIGKVYARFLQHKETRRAQSDSVALDMVETLSDRVAQVEAAAEQERAMCDAQLRALRHELRNELTFSDALVLAIRHAPERALQIIEDALAMREARRRQHQGEFRNDTQAHVSAANLIGDAVGSAAMVA